MRETVAEVPDGYEPPTFQTAALQHTDVKLTWDEDDDSRKRALSSKKLTGDQIREDDFKVASQDTNTLSIPEVPSYVTLTCTHNKCHIFCS